MEEGILASDYLALGQSLYFFRTLYAGAPWEVYQQNLTSFLTALNRCDFPDQHRAASDLTGINASVYRSATGKLMIAPEAGQDIANLFHGTIQSIQHAAEKRRLLVQDVSAASPKLRALASKVELTVSQKNLCAETVRCLECGAYRSAIVMGWNLAFECIRQWIFDNHRIAFNGKSTVQIADYDDFLTHEQLTEHRVLEICHSAGLIKTKLFQRLVEYLRMRNQYAHPNDKMPSVHQANADIERMLDIVEGPPFK